VWIRKKKSADTDEKNKKVAWKTRKTDFFPKKLRKRIKSGKKLADTENLEKNGSKKLFLRKIKKNL
jgi:hypothetical protein